MSGHIYTNPDIDSSIKVEQVSVFLGPGASARTTAIAENVQSVIHGAWVNQFAGRFSPDQIAETASPDNPELVRAQAAKLEDSGSDSSKPLFVLARAEKAQLMNIFGIGKALEVHRRLWRPSLADVSNVFVMPNYQRRGTGSAILRSLLDRFPDDMETAVYDFPFNFRVVNTLGRLGFSAHKTWKEEYFGQEVDQAWFRGPLVGELKQTMETKRPWLKDRVRIPASFQWSNSG